jgi:hypothetical protein
MYGSLLTTNVLLTLTAWGVCVCGRCMGRLCVCPCRIFGSLEQVLARSFGGSMPGERDDWQEVEGSWVLRPPGELLGLISEGPQVQRSVGPQVQSAQELGRDWLGQQLRASWAVPACNSG